MKGRLSNLTFLRRISNLTSLGRISNSTSLGGISNLTSLGKISNLTSLGRIILNISETREAKQKSGKLRLVISLNGGLKKYDVYAIPSERINIVDFFQVSRISFILQTLIQ